jgi:molybdopterin-guanine dinucleotide biosynthesis protein A
MIAIVTAGGQIEANHPLYSATHGGLKSMMMIAGKPMIQWVLDALSRSTSISRVIVVGLPPETDLACAHPMSLLHNTGSMIGNIRAGAAEGRLLEPGESHALLATGDIPALRSETVDWMTCQFKDPEQDIYYTLVERKALEAEFPGARFSYYHLKDMQVVSGQVRCFRLDAALEESPLWKRLSTSGGGPFRQASILGYDATLFLMLRQLSLKAAESAVCKRLGIKGTAVLCPYPEIGMDVDRPAQLEIMREYLSRRPA